MSEPTTEGAFDERDPAQVRMDERHLPDWATEPWGPIVLPGSLAERLGEPDA